jgi:hypothetical protein
VVDGWDEVMIVEFMQEHWTVIAGLILAGWMSRSAFTGPCVRATTEVPTDDEEEKNISAPIDAKVQPWYIYHSERE